MSRLLPPAVLGVVLTFGAAVADDAIREHLKPLDQYAGVWSTSVAHKPGKWKPEGGTETIQESTALALKDRFCIGREITGDGSKSLWLMTYDPKTQAYPFWMFTSSGLLGGEWSSTWDGKAFTSQATDTPKGWTSRGTSEFPDKSTIAMSFWMKDDTGTLLMDAAGKKTRQPEAAREKVLAAWSKVDKTPTPLPEELKVLERLAGSWDSAMVSKVALWTPKEVKTTSKVTREWMLDGTFLLDSSTNSDDTESLALTTYDPEEKKYRSWWFHSDGSRNKSAGEWDAKTATLNYAADLGDGLVARSAVRFVDKDHHVWTVIVKDSGGKVYFDAEWTVTRRKP